ncbi:hypothetical protein Tco_0093322 [Tanacetum coccineum]
MDFSHGYTVLAVNGCCQEMGQIEQIDMTSRQDIEQIDLTTDKILYACMRCADIIFVKERNIRRMEHRERSVNGLFKVIIGNVRLKLMRLKLVWTYEPFGRLLALQHSMLSPATFQPFRQRHVAGETYPQRNVAGEKLMEVSSMAKRSPAKSGPHVFFGQGIGATVAVSSPATCRWGNF